MLVEFLRPAGGFGPVEAGSPALRDVTVEGELGNHQDAASDVLHGAVHVALLVLKDPQVGNFVQQFVQIIVGISLFDPEEYD